MNNEEQMCAEFEAWWTRQPKDPTKPIGPYAAWQAATASKQREIDALNQQVLELSAQVEAMRGAYEKSVYDGIDHFSEAISATPSAALEAHDNEVAAKALEEAARVCRHLNGNACGSGFASTFDAADAIQAMAAELRSKK